MRDERVFLYLSIYVIRWRVAFFFAIKAYNIIYYNIRRKIVIKTRTRVVGEEKNSFTSHRKRYVDELKYLFIYFLNSISSQTRRRK